MVKLRGVWLLEAPTAVPTRLFPSPKEPSKTWTRWITALTRPLDMYGNGTHTTDQSRGSQAANNPSTDARGMRKRKSAGESEARRMRKSPRTARQSERSRAPVTSYNETTLSENSDADTNSDSSEDVVPSRRSCRSKHRSKPNEAFAVTRHRS